MSEMAGQEGVPDEAVRWAAAGAAAFAAAAGGAAAQPGGLASPSGLPGWRQAHVVAHVAHNADALINLLTWARTGVETPMYASATERAEGIEADSGRADPDLLADLAAASGRWDAAVAAVPPGAWAARVRSAQGADIPAALVPWLRARETWVHAVDLAADVTFADVPLAVAQSLLDEAAGGYASRAGGPAVLLRATDSDRTWALTPTGAGAGGGATIVEVTGPAASLAAYATGRPVPGALRAADGDVRVLPPWL